MLRDILLSAALLMPATALAAPVGVTLSQDNTITMFQGTRGMQKLSRWNPPAGRIKIFDTFGKGHQYNDSAGRTISNAESDVGYQQWFAFAIIPQVTVTVTEIVEAVGHVAGTESVTIALLADDNGSPGKVLEKKTVKKLETFGDCCGVAVDHLKTGVKITAGTTYWIAAILPKTKQANTWDAWGYSSENTEMDTAAFYNSTGWNVTTAKYCAFAVYGE